MRREDTLIVGGGPAGSAAAIRLPMLGQRPLLVERTAAPADALCGGFLSWATVARLERLGVDVAALGGHPVGRVRVIAGDRVVETALPGGAIGLSRRTLDAALLAKVDRVERGVAIRMGEPGRVWTADGAEIACAALILATGKHELRGLARPRDAAGLDPALGLRLRGPAGAGLAGMIELHLFDRGYAGIVVQEDGCANICLAVRRSRLTEAGGRPGALLAALAAEAPRFADRLGAAGAVQTIAHIPYGWRATGGQPSLYRTGDQAAVIPSLAGEGIGIALASGVAAAGALASGQDGAAFQRRFARAAARPLAVAGMAYGVATAPRLAGAAAMLLGRAPGLLGLLARATRLR